MKGFKNKDVCIVFAVYGLGLVLFLLHGDVNRYRSATPPLTVAEVWGHPEEAGRTADQSPFALEIGRGPAFHEGNAGLEAHLGRPLEQPVRRVQLERRYPVGSRVEQVKHNVSISLARVIGSSSLVTDPGAPFPEPYSLRGTLGHAYLSTGDYESARNFLREAVRMQPDGAVRNYLCGELAWLESDLQTAARLLGQSLAEGPGPEEYEHWAFVNAVELALATETEELALELLEQYPDCRAAIPKESHLWDRHENRWIWHHTQQQPEPNTAPESTH